MEHAKIMVVEDDADIRQGIRILLESEDYAVAEAEDGEQALALFDDSFDLVILDVMMPRLSGIDTCRELRRRSFVPILFLSARSQENDKTMGLLSGGDDYLTKPFSYAELTARVKALLRRYCTYKGKDAGAGEAADCYCEHGDFRINTRRNEFFLAGVPVSLTDLEYRILLLMMRHPERVFSTQEIYEQVWNEPYFYISNGTVMVHIRQLRVKVEQDPQDPQHIRTVWGRGYCFV